MRIAKGGSDIRQDAGIVLERKGELEWVANEEGRVYVMDLPDENLTCVVDPDEASSEIEVPWRGNRQRRGDDEVDSALRVDDA